MGKIRRLRTKFHASAVKSDHVEDKNVALPGSQIILPPIFPIKGIFTNLNDSNREKEFDSKSMVSIGKLSVKSQGQPQKKKDKRKLRHKEWIEKIEVIKQARKETNQRNKKKKSQQDQPIASQLTSDLADLVQQYPTMQQKKQKISTLKKNARSKSTMRSNVRQKILKEEHQRYQNVLKNQLRKPDPLKNTIKHLQAKINQEEL